MIDGKRILFWDEPALGTLAPLLSFLNVKPRGQPSSFVRRDIPWEDREQLGKALVVRNQSNPWGGDILESYLGSANCRMCGITLGSRDLFGYGFIWPERAEHYILDHNVWTPDCTEMLHAVRRTVARPR